MIDLDAIEQRATAARPGPWIWRGDIETHHCDLVSLAFPPNRAFVLTFERWGMQHAQPVFCDHETGLLTSPMKEDGGVRFDVAPHALTIDDPDVYRTNFSQINHPDAIFIAHARQDVDDLIARVRELEAENERLQRTVEFLEDNPQMRGAAA